MGIPFQWKTIDNFTVSSTEVYSRAASSSPIRALAKPCHLAKWHRQPGGPNIHRRGSFGSVIVCHTRFTDAPNLLFT